MHTNQNEHKDKRHMASLMWTLEGKRGHETKIGEVGESNKRVVKGGRRFRYLISMYGDSARTPKYTYSRKSDFESRGHGLNGSCESSEEQFLWQE